MSNTGWAIVAAAVIIGGGLWYKSTMDREAAEAAARARAASNPLMDVFNQFIGNVGNTVGQTIGGVIQSMFGGAGMGTTTSASPTYAS